ncbi:hypothetical protein H8E07_07475 [bacterium]|nr:hypothetical protein [bacterium]
MNRPHLLVLLSLLPVAAGATSFTAETVATGYGVVHALDTGELVPGHDGCEVVVLDPAGSVHLVVPGEGVWPSIVLLAGEDPCAGAFSRPTVEVGELIAAAAGEEVAVLSERHLNVIRRVGSSDWFVERIFDAGGYVGNAWGARVGDYRPSRPGEEIFMIYEGVMDFSFGTVFHHDGSDWRDFEVYSAEVGMDSAAGEFDAAHGGAEFVVTTEMGPTYQLHEAGDPPPPWPRTEVWNDFDNAGWVCAVADVDTDVAGNEVVYGSRYSDSIMVSRPDGGGTHHHQVVFVGDQGAGPGNMWDLAVGDVLPASPAAEIVGVDDGGHVYLVRREDDVWVGETIWTDDLGEIYAVCSADFRPAVAGDEILVGDAAGRLVLLTRDDASPIPVAPPIGGPRITGVRCRPNPGNPAVEIGFELTVAAPVLLAIHAPDGRLVRTLVETDLPAGAHAFPWRGRDEAGRAVAAGPYLFQVRAAGETAGGIFSLVK